MHLFVDLDGVLADFDGHHETVLGRRTSKLADDVDWDQVRQVPNFYLDMPPMADAHVLWRGVRRLRPTILTGVPSSIASAEREKRRWVATWLGEDVPVTCCRSRDKCEHLQGQGDVLLDDWPKYRSLWEGRGGTFVVHENAQDSLAQLRRLGFDVASNHPPGR